MVNEENILQKFCSKDDYLDSEPKAVQLYKKQHKLIDDYSY